MLYEVITDILNNLKSDRILLSFWEYFQKSFLPYNENFPKERFQFESHFFLIRKNFFEPKNQPYNPLVQVYRRIDRR